MTRATWLLPLLLVACSNGGESARPTPAPVVTTTTAAPTTAPPTTAPPKPTPSPTPRITVVRGEEFVQFSTPSKNIGCGLTADSAYCQMSQRDWPLPPRPKDCDADWGAGAEVSADGVSIGVCASDTVQGSDRIVAYGTGIRLGDAQCVSERKGLTCTYLKTRHGFFLSRESYRVF